MKKRTFLFLTALLLAASAAALYSIRQFYAPGIHKFGKAIHYEVFDSTYIVGSDGETTNLTFCGTYDGKAHNGGCGSFFGAVEVAAYPVSYGAANGFITNDGRGILFTPRGNYLTASYSSTTMNDEGYAVSAGYEYTVVLNQDAPEEIIIIIYDSDDHPVAAVINGTDQDASNQIYYDYIDTIS